MSGSVVLLSGGLDSSVCFHVAIAKWPPVHAFFVDYGQQNRDQELAAARAIAGGAPFHLEDLSSASFGAGSALRTAGAEVLPGLAEVRGRNSIFLISAAAYAADLNLGRIVIGSNLEDYEEFSDCRPRYLVAMERALILGLGHNLRIEAPLGRLTKAGAVSLGRSLGSRCWEAIGQSWSCYTPTNGSPCGICAACIKRNRALRGA